MKVLVAAASKYGATAEIAEAIGKKLAELGVAVTVKPPEEVASVDEFDAVILGSGVYAGRWLKTARAFADQFEEHLKTRRLWLFSSGPIGDPPKPEADEAVDVGDLLATLQPIEHRLFEGKLDKAILRFGDRAIVAALKAADGDYRNWDDISTWAATIGASLSHR